MTHAAATTITVGLLIVMCCYLYTAFRSLIDRMTDWTDDDN